MIGNIVKFLLGHDIVFKKILIKVLVAVKLLYRVFNFKK